VSKEKFWGEDPDKMEESKLIKVFREFAEVNDIDLEDTELSVSEIWDLARYRKIVEVYRRGTCVTEYYLPNPDAVGIEDSFIDITGDVYDGVYATLDSDYEKFITLDGREIEATIPYSYYEELQYYGNKFRLVVKLREFGTVVPVSGDFLDNTVRFYYPVDDLSDSELEALEKLLFDSGLLEKVLEVFRTYRWVPMGFCGYYEGSSTGVFTKVVEGWVALGTTTDLIKYLSEFEKLKLPSEDYPDYPVLFVFPSSSNICVQYFDVYVPTEHVNDFRSRLRVEKNHEEFNYSKGIWVLVH